MDIKHLIQTLDGIHSKETPVMVDGKTLLNETSSGGSSAAGGIATIEASVAPPKAKSKLQRRVPADDKKPVKEDEINEEDLLVAPGVFKPQTGFTPRDRVRTDHEVGMAVSDLIQCAKNAETIHNILAGISEQQGLPGWVQEKITKAADYLNTVAEYMEGEYHQHNAGIAEASSPAQQAAIAVNMKKQGKKPKSKTTEDTVEEGWKGALAGAALAGLSAMSPAQARVSIGPDGQPTQSYAQQLSQQPGFQASQEKPTNTVLPGSNLPRADAVNRQAGTVTVDGRDYKMVMLEPDSMRPRGGQRIGIPQAMMGERGIGFYIGVLAGETVYVLPRGVNESVREGTEAQDNLVSILNSFDYYSDNGKVYVNATGDKIVRQGSNWKHLSGKVGRGADELGVFLSSKQGVNEGTITEKAKSKQQQKFFGMVHAIQKGKKIKGASAELKKAAKDMSKGDVEDFAKTKHKGLPTKKKAKKKVDESLQAIEQRLDESWKKWSGS